MTLLKTAKGFVRRFCLFSAFIAPISNDTLPAKNLSDSSNIMYKKLTEWVKEYAPSATDDQRAINDFIECENRESLSSIKNELTGIIQGNYDENVLEQLLGQSRKTKYGSYIEWAKYMLLWIASYKS